MRRSRFAPFRTHVLCGVACLFLLAAGARAQEDGPQRFLLMAPIEQALFQGDMRSLLEHCPPHLGADCDPPLGLEGYWRRETWAERLRRSLQGLELTGHEWTSMHIEDQTAIQALTLICRVKGSRFQVTYKTIWFMNRKGDGPWMLHHLQGVLL